MRFVICFKGVDNLYLKSLLKIWSETENQNVRSLCFLCIRELCLLHSKSFLELSLKGIYLNYVNKSKNMSANTITSITVMRNCVVELYNIDLSLSYQHCFAYIRQLAIHLRSVYKNKTTEKYIYIFHILCMNSIGKIYNWEYINSIRFFVSLLCDSNAKDALEALVYPLVQV